MNRYTGQPLRRQEDPRLLTGRGQYVDDIRLPGMLHAAVLRSPHGSARIRSVDAAAARRLPGVAAVLTAANLGARLKPLPQRFPHPALHYQPQYPLAAAQVRFVGEPVAVVVAESRYVAEDALELIEVDYTPLPAVSSVEAALAPGAPLVHPAAGTNRAAAVSQGYGDVAAAFASAAVVVRDKLTIGRCSASPMETRGIVAAPDPVGGGVTAWSSTQTPHMQRAILAGYLGLSEHQVRIVCPDVGGGFGAKEPAYPEDVLIPLAALELGRPVKWVEDRREHLAAGVHERTQVHWAELALDRDGRLLGLRSRFIADTGAYSPWGIVVPLITATMIPGPYRLPAYQSELEVAWTNTGPQAPYRGAGRPQATFVMERMLDRGARELGLDPIALRRRNYIQPEEYPYANGLMGRDGKPMEYDSGNFPALLDQALERLDLDGCRSWAAAERAAGRRIGIGIASGMENGGLGPAEGVLVRLEPTGGAVAYTATPSQGQGHATSLAQVAADELGLRPDQVAVIEGDTATLPTGSGTFASRTAVVTGSAVRLAAARLREKAIALAARLLEAAEEDLELRDGAVAVRGAPGRNMSLAELAFAGSAPFPGRPFPPGLTPGLEALEYYSPQAPTYSGAVHVAVVEVDPATGDVRVLRYICVEDCGNIINPLVVEGQLHGGVAAGLGNALFEEIIYDADGQLLTGSLMDYLLPAAGEVPLVETGHVCTPSPLNPLGAKGVGESATIPVPAAINAAVDDALADLGVRASMTPLSPWRVRALIAAAQGP